MPHILSTLEFAAQSKDRLWQMMTRIYEQLARVVNGGISFGRAPAHGLPQIGNRTFSDNIDCVWIEIPTVAGTFTITHNLGRPLSAYIIARKSGPVDIYDGPTGSNGNPTLTPNQTYVLRATAAVLVVLLVF